MCAPPLEHSSLLGRGCGQMPRETRGEKQPADTRERTAPAVQLAGTLRTDLRPRGLLEHQADDGSETGQTSIARRQLGPTHLPRGSRSNRRRISPGDGCWQVFGLASAPAFAAFLGPPLPKHRTSGLLAFLRGVRGSADAPRMMARVPTLPRIPDARLPQNSSSRMYWIESPRRTIASAASLNTTMYESPEGSK